MLKRGKLGRLIFSKVKSLKISKTELVYNWLKYNKKQTKKCVFLDLSLNFIIKRIIFGTKF
jgi:hypothetical protein